MKYLVNKNGQFRTSYHKIHKENCSKKPKKEKKRKEKIRKENTIFLGDCMCSLEAKSRAKEYFADVTGCKHCCKEIFFQKQK